MAFKIDPKYYTPDSNGKFIEVDKWDMANGRLQRTGERMVIPLEFFEQEPETTMENFDYHGDNPIRVRLKYKWYESLFVEGRQLFRNWCDRIFKRNKTQTS